MNIMFDTLDMLSVPPEVIDKMLSQMSSIQTLDQWVRIQELSRQTVY